MNLFHYIIVLLLWTHGNTTCSIQIASYETYKADVIPRLMQYPRGSIQRMTYTSKSNKLITY